MPDENPAEKEDTTHALAVEQHYDELDWFYEDAWGENLHHGLWRTGKEGSEEAVENLRDLIAQQAEISAGDTVCDIGCGFGAAARHWAATYRALVTGITLSGKQWEKAKLRAERIGASTPPPRFLHGDWLDNSLEDEEFDAITSIECLSHIDDRDRFFREVARTLKPNGRIAMSAWLQGSRAMSPFVQRWLESVNRGARFASIANSSELQSLLAKYDFELTAWEEAGASVKRTWRILVVRLAWRCLTRRVYRQFFWTSFRGDRFLPLTVLQTWIAFELGVLQYVIFAARKPEKEAPISPQPR